MIEIWSISRPAPSPEKSKNNCVVGSYNSSTDPTGAAPTSDGVIASNGTIDLKNNTQVLGDVYHWFTEGFDTADLQDAKSLLDALA